MNLNYPNHIAKQNFCMMVRVDCGFSFLYDNNGERKETIKSDGNSEKER